MFCLAMCAGILHTGRRPMLAKNLSMDNVEKAMAYARQSKKLSGILISGMNGAYTQFHQMKDVSHTDKFLKYL